MRNIPFWQNKKHKNSSTQKKEKKERNGENKCKNRTGWKPATTRKEILQEMELISYYSEDFFFPDFLQLGKKRN